MATWPGSLPDFEVGLKDVGQDGTVRTPMDAGPVKTRRRFTATSRYLTGTIYLTDQTQRAALDAFFETTLGGGSLPFTKADPRDGTQQSLRFMRPPEYEHRFGDGGSGTDQYRVSLSLEILP